MTTFTVQTLPHPRRGWVILPLAIGEDVVVDMVLNTAVAVSAISERVREDLLRHEQLPPMLEQRYVLHNVRLAGHQLADLPVRVRSRLALLGVEGYLGLDFLQQFSDIRFHVPSYRLTLTLP